MWGYVMNIVFCVSRSHKVLSKYILISRQISSLDHHCVLSFPTHMTQFRHADNSCFLCILGIVRFPPSFSAYPGPFGTWHPKELKDLRRVPRMCIQVYTLVQRLWLSTLCRVVRSSQSGLLQLDITRMQNNIASNPQNHDVDCLLYLTGVPWCRVIPGHRNYDFDPASVFLSTRWWSQHPASQRWLFLVPLNHYETATPTSGFRARGARRGFSPAAIARHSQSARVHKTTLCHFFFEFSRLNPKVKFVVSAGTTQNGQKNARNRFWCKKVPSEKKIGFSHPYFFKKSSRAGSTRNFCKIVGSAGWTLLWYKKFELSWLNLIFG